MLQELIQSLGISPDKEGFTRLANDLSQLAGKVPPWSYRYVRSVHAGDYAPSKKMQAAIVAKLAEVDGASGELAASVPITVYVSPDRANELAGAYIMGDVKICPTCTKRFTPNVPWRRYCGECREVQKYNPPA